MRVGEPVTLDLRVRASARPGRAARPRPSSAVDRDHDVRLGAAQLGGAPAASRAARPADRGTAAGRPLRGSVRRRRRWRRPARIGRSRTASCRPSDPGRPGTGGGGRRAGSLPARWTVPEGLRRAGCAMALVCPIPAPRRSRVTARWRVVVSCRHDQHRSSLPARRVLRMPRAAAGARPDRGPRRAAAPGTAPPSRPADPRSAHARLRRTAPRAARRRRAAGRRERQLHHRADAPGRRRR